MGGKEWNRVSGTSMAQAASAPAREPADMYLVDIATMPNTSAPKMAAAGAMGSNAQKKVATPLPPRKFKNTGQLWPEITARAAAISAT